MSDPITETFQLSDGFVCTVDVITQEHLTYDHGIHIAVYESEQTSGNLDEAMVPTLRQFKEIWPKITEWLEMKGLVEA